MVPRNLLSRLNSRPDEDLTRIASEWRVGTSSRDRAGLVTTLYRTLTDPVAVREWLPDRDDVEAKLIGYLVEHQEQMLTIPELAASLDWDEEQTRDAANALHKAGVISRENEKDAVPVGELPRVVMPREVASVFQRVQSEMLLGDRSGVPLRVLLEWLEDGELEDAARDWGMTVVPGTIPRKELTSRLLNHLADPRVIDLMIGGLSAEASSVFQAVTNRGGSAMLDDALLEARLIGDDQETITRRRSVLNRLEQQLLVWPAYRADGARLAFVPREILEPQAPTAGSVPMPAVAPITAVAAPPRPEHAVAWDLLTLLRELQQHPLVEGQEPSRSQRRRLLETWWPSDEERFSDYFAFLLFIAKSEGLIEAPADEGRRWMVLPSVRAWRDRSFPDQTRQVQWWWLNAPEWIECQAQREVEIWGVEWPAFRKQLLGQLEEIAKRVPAPAWLSEEALASGIAAGAPEILGPRFSAATARVAGEAPTGGDTSAARSAVLDEVLRLECSTGLTWFGVVEHGMAPEIGEVMRINGSRIAAIADDRRSEDPLSASGSALAIEADGRIVLRVPTPLRVWSLGAFAEVEQLSAPATYRLTKKSIAGALAAGFDIGQIDQFLSRQSGGALPEALRIQLRDWSGQVRPVKLANAIVLTLGEVSDRPRLVENLSAAGLTVATLGDQSVVVELAAGPGAQERVETILKELGMTIQQRPA